MNILTRLNKTMRTQEEIKRQIDGLEAMKEWLLEYSHFGDPNHLGIDAQIDVLKGEADVEDFLDGNENEDYIFSEAERAETWLDGIDNEDLFEVR